jgi:hypothetical protein
MQSQETFNTNIIANFLIFPMVIYTPYSDQHNESYSHWQVADQRKFQQNLEAISVWSKGKNLF